MSGMKSYIVRCMYHWAEKVYSFIQQLFIEQPLYARYFLGPGEQQWTKQSPCPNGVYT